MSFPKRTERYDRYVARRRTVRRAFAPLENGSLAPLQNDLLALREEVERLRHARGDSRMIVATAVIGLIAALMRLTVDASTPLRNGWNALVKSLHRR